MYICIYVYMYICIYVYMYMYIYICIHVCIAVLLLSESEQCALLALIFDFMDASCASTYTNQSIYIPSGKLT